MHGSTGHTHCHHHGHGAHSHGAPKSFGRAFALGIALNSLFVIVEMAFGYLSGSLSLVADAGHNLTDVLALALAWGGTILAGRAPSVRFTYGLNRSSILAALVNAMLLLVALGGIMWESIHRFWTPASVDGPMMVGVAIVGIVVNASTALLFFRGRDSDINVRGAYLHMAADAGVSLGVVVAGVAISWTNLPWIDPVVSLVICVVILIGSLELLRESVSLAVDAVPAGIDPIAVRTFLRELPGVSDVHDLHIWALSTTRTALTAHLVREGHQIDDEFLFEVTRELRHRYGIEHPTLQIESGATSGQCNIECAKERE